MIINFRFVQMPIIFDFQEHKDFILSKYFVTFYDNIE